MGGTYYLYSCKTPTINIRTITCGWHLRQESGCGRIMSEALRAHKDYLTVLKRSHAKVRSAILENADCKLVNCLCEVALNTLHGAVPLSKGQKKRLVPHK